MIIGSTDIDYNNLRKFIGKPDELVVYVEESVPIWARHVQHIVDNQRFYVAIHLRGMLTIPYKPKMELVNALIDGIHINGVMSCFTEIKDIVDACDKTKLIALIEKRLNDEQCR